MRNKMLVRFALAFVLCCSIVSCDTADNVESPNYFVKYFGGSGNQEGVDLVVNPDGTILLFGNTTIPGDANPKLYLAKCDADGKLLWERSGFGGNYKNQARDIELTSDGRIVLVATSEYAANDNDILIVITDANGVVLQSKMKGYQGSDEDASSVTQISDGFIVTGSTSKVDQKANQVAGDQRDVLNFRFYDDIEATYPSTWTETFGPGTYDAGTKVIEISPGQFYFFGSTNAPRGVNPVNDNYWVFPMNNFGDANPDRGGPLFPSDEVLNERLSSVTLSPIESGEGYLLAGIRRDESGGSNICITKLRKDLRYKDSQSEAIQISDKVISTELKLGTLVNPKVASVSSRSSGFIVVSNENNLGNENFYLTKIDNNVSNAWSNPLGFVFGGDNSDRIGSVAELPDGSILMIGTFSIGDDNQQKMTLIKVNKEGKFSN